jgi:hypothetical protein
MGVSDLTDPHAIQAAMDECDELGHEAFRRRYKAGPALRHFVIRRGEAYDSKAIVAAAHRFEFGEALTPDQFRGGATTVAPKLRELGFEVVEQRLAGEPEGVAQRAEPTEETIRRISGLVPSDLAGDVIAAVTALGGEAQRVEVVDGALGLRGWTEEELAVVSWYAGAARHYHLRTLADYAVTVCKDRGQLVDGTERGRWRLAEELTILRHPHARIFTAGVGVAGGPVDNTWRADDQAHLWFSQRSRQLSRGDHVFALAAGRGSVVLGLFEVLSAGVYRTQSNPWNPARWPWAVDVRAIASVPPEEATSAQTVTAPRATAQRIANREAQDALYATVTAHALGEMARIDGAQTERRINPTARAITERHARDFDPQHVPNPTASSAAILDLTETIALQEKARQGHHALLVSLHAGLLQMGWTGLEEIPAAIDLRGESPVAEAVIFEAKTIRAENEVSQCRSALAQLLEYRLEYGHANDALCLVVDSTVSQHRVELLERLGVGVIFAQADVLTGLNARGEVLLQGVGR